MFKIRKWIIKLDNIGFVSVLETIGMTRAFHFIYEHEISNSVAKVIRTHSPQEEIELQRVAKLLKGTLI